MALHGQETVHVVRCSLFSPSEANDMITQKVFVPNLSSLSQPHTCSHNSKGTSLYLSYNNRDTGVIFDTTQEENGRVYFGDIVYKPSLSP